MTTILGTPCTVRNGENPFLEVNQVEGGDHTEVVLAGDNFPTVVAAFDYFQASALIHALTRAVNVMDQPAGKQECPDCHGDGYHPEDKTFGCQTCRSAGEIPPKGYTTKISGLVYVFDGKEWKLVKGFIAPSRPARPGVTHWRKRR